MRLTEPCRPGMCAPSSRSLLMDAGAVVFHDVIGVVRRA